MIGIIANVLCVIVGGLLGAAFGKKIPGEVKTKVNSVFGICAICMGISSVVLMKNMPAVILAMILGTAFGALVHLGDLIQKGGLSLQKVVSKVVKPDESVNQDEFNSLLVTTIVLFCSSGSGIYGSLLAGMTGECTILLSKSILDLFTALIFACTLGYVTALIAILQTVIFVALFFLSKLIFPHTTPDMINDFKACGGFILIATGLRICKIKEFSIADMIPAMLLTFPLSHLWQNFVVPLL